MTAAPTCAGACPAPGDCERCNDALYQELIEDPAIQASYAEWLRTSGPLPSREHPDTECLLCGAPDPERTHCKTICRNCGYTRDCSDP